MYLYACLPSSRRNTKGGRIAVVVGSPKSINDGIFGYGASPKARKCRGVAVAKMNDWSLVLFVQILSQGSEDSSNGNGWRRCILLIFVLLFFLVNTKKTQFLMKKRLVFHAFSVAWAKKHEWVVFLGWYTNRTRISWI